MASHDVAEVFAIADFDPDFDDVTIFMDHIEVQIDGARPGVLTHHGKIALITRYCSHPDVRELVRSWRSHGIDVDGGANNIAWQHATWGNARESMIDVFGDVDAKTLAIEMLVGGGDGSDGLKQNCRVPVHQRKVARISNDAGVPIDWESGNQLDKMRYVELLSDELADGMEDCCLQPPKQFVLGKMDEEYCDKVKHCVAYAKSQDKALVREAKKRGLGITYWQEPRSARRTIKAKDKKKTGIHALATEEPRDERMSKLEEEHKSLKGLITKIQVDTTTDFQTLKTDMNQRLSVMETKTDHNTTLQERCLALLENRPTEQSADAKGFKPESQRMANSTSHQPVQQYQQPAWQARPATASRWMGQSVLAVQQRNRVQRQRQRTFI